MSIGCFESVNLPCPEPLNCSHIADYINGFCPLTVPTVTLLLQVPCMLHTLTIMIPDIILSDIAVEVAVANSVSIDATVKTGSRS